MTSRARTHTARFPLPRGPVAAPAKAWGADFPVFLGGMAERPFEEEGDMAVVDVCGPLVQKGNPFFCNYEDLRAAVALACESSAASVCLRINSPGGDFAGSLELSRDIREMCSKAGKKLIAFTDCQALSAGYALACAAEEIVITESAFVGSVGVWAALCDEVALDKARGLNVVIVPSGSQKAERNPHVAITEDAVANLQAQVDDMASMFFDLVADQRGMARSKVEALQGSEQFGARAVALGLADRIVNSWAEFSALGGNVMAKSTKEARAAYRANLAKLAADDSDDGKEARSALSAMDKEDEKNAKAAEEGDEDKKDDKEAKASAKAEGDEPDGDEAKGKAKGEGDDEEKKASAQAKGGHLRVAASSTSRELDLAARVHALEAERAEERLSVERAKLLDSRPDFAPEVRASLESADLSFVKNAVKNWKRLATPTQAAAGAIVPGATRGDTQESDPSTAPQYVGQETDEQFIERKMGLAKSSGGVVHQGSRMILGAMTPEEAKAALVKLGEKGAL